MTYRRKYGNKKVEFNGHTFDSKKEYERYCDLLMFEKAGKISKLTLQPAFTLQDGFVDRDGKKHRPIRYIADFYYIDDEGHEIVEDVKGMKTKEYMIKKKMFLAKRPDLCFREI